MFLTPVVYSADNIPEDWLFLYKLNPMYWVVEGFRWSILGSGPAPIEPIGLILLVFMIVLLVSGFFIFRKTELTIVDWL
jgi:ABC-type polysaccharide/polyol phosphate export permease